MPSAFPLSNFRVTWKIIIPLFLFFLFKIAVFIYAVNKGLDMGDEGAVLLGYKYFAQYDTFDFFFTVRKYFPFIEFNIINIRLFKIAIDLFTLAVLSFGVYRWFESPYSIFRTGTLSFPYVYLFGGMGLFIGIIPRGISYNDFSNFSILTAFGILLYVFSKNKEEIKNRLKYPLLLTIAGFLIGWQFFIKYPCCIFFLPYSLIIISIWAMLSPLYVFLCFMEVPLYGFINSSPSIKYIPKQWVMEFSHCSGNTLR